MEKPHPLSELRKKYRELVNANVAHNEGLTKLDRVAIWITDHVGSMGFFILILVWTALWLGYNMLAPTVLHLPAFDPFPAFVLWLFISNMIQIFLMPLIMVGQNLQARHSEARAEADYEVNQKSEAEIEAILQQLENQNQMILSLLKRFDIKS